MLFKLIILLSWFNLNYKYKKDNIEKLQFKGFANMKNKNKLIVASIIVIMQQALEVTRSLR